MEILFNDCGFYRDERNAWLSNEFNRELHYLDKISKSEASIVIDKLKEIRGDSE